MRQFDRERVKDQLDADKREWKNEEKQAAERLKEERKAPDPPRENK